MDKTIKLTGQGIATSAPDTIIISLMVMGEDKEYKKAMEECDKLVVNLKSNLTKAGFKEDDIKTTDFRVSTATKYVEGFKTSKYVFDKYVVKHNIDIEFDFDKKELAKCIDILSSVLANPTININFSIKNTEPLKKQALKQAVNQAKEDAELLAESAGVELGDIKLIDHSFRQINIHRPSQVYAEYAGNVRGKTASYESMESINVRDIKIEANVTMEWEIK